MLPHYDLTRRKRAMAIGRGAISEWNRVQPVIQAHRIFRGRI